MFFSRTQEEHQETEVRYEGDTGFCLPGKSVK